MRYMMSFFFSGEHMWTHMGEEQNEVAIVQKHIVSAIERTAIEQGEVVYDITLGSKGRRRIIVRYTPSYGDDGSIRNYSLAVTLHDRIGRCEWTAHNDLERDNLAHVDKLHNQYDED